MNPIRTGGRAEHFLTRLVAMLLVLGSGCDSVTAPLAEALNDSKSGAGNAAQRDVFTQAAEENPKDRLYLEAARPILTSIAARDYAKLHRLLSSHSQAKTRPDQFVPGSELGNQPAAAPLENLTQELFVKWMQKMEQQFAVPDSIRHVYVESTDPKVLAGKGDRLEVMLAIGGMPAEIPVEIRKASIRASVQCQFPEDQVKKIAADLKISEDQVRSGNWPENDEYSDVDDYRPYFNVKFVLVEEEGQLKVGYFEFMPPSMLD